MAPHHDFTEYDQSILDDSEHMTSMAKTLRHRQSLNQTKGGGGCLTGGGGGADVACQI